MVDIDKDGESVSRCFKNEIFRFLERNGCNTNSQYSLKLTESSNLIY